MLTERAAYHVCVSVLTLHSKQKIPYIVFILVLSPLIYYGKVLGTETDCNLRRQMEVEEVQGKEKKPKKIGFKCIKEKKLHVCALLA